MLVFESGRGCLVGDESHDLIAIVVRQREFGSKYKSAVVYAR